MRERILESGLITGRVASVRGDLVPCWIYRSNDKEWAGFSLNQVAMKVAASGSVTDLTNLIDEITLLKITDSDLECFFEMDEEVLVSSDTANNAEE